jgi:hypothetical protein
MTGHALAKWAVTMGRNTHSSRRVLKKAWCELQIAKQADGE